MGADGAPGSGDAERTRQLLADALPAVWLVLLAALLGPLWRWPPPDLPPPPVTFFSPRAYPEALAAHTHLGMVYVTSPAQLRDSLAVARRHGSRLQLDFSTVLLQDRAPARIDRRYRDALGQWHTKSFAPLPEGKLKDVPADDALALRMASYWPVLQAYRAQVDTLFLIDEPYMHGVSHDELGRAASRVRSLMLQHGLRRVQLGVVFSGAMFDAGFARHVADGAHALADEVERYHQRAQREADPQHAAWAARFARERLTTYDLAGNLYAGGGIPREFDVVAYNLYTATLLQDAVHRRTLAWFAELGASPACQPFKGSDLRDWRQRLSFYRDGPVQADQAGDRRLLAAVFRCKTESVHALLQAQPARPGRRFQLWGESSANGFLEFDARGHVDAEQPELLVAARVDDEVARTLAFLGRHADFYRAGLVFFVYDDTVDPSIGLHIQGASHMPAVMARVFRAAGKAPP
ncbi:hypothetical protein CCO03_02820 [Comamonas serinivorans]|uniref:Uncharacterized protein n=1 Tax=Comamonas serinivorans TaxID=1082851 RepID=A0A1Y0EK01_9BURK|nr:hypothetical protein CCO03_02820 [Comamonas serinivorans]